MVRYVVLALVLATGGATRSFDVLLNLMPAWAVDDADAGGHWDPWGGTDGSTSSDAESDAGNHWDPWG